MKRHPLGIGIKIQDFFRKTKINATYALIKQNENLTMDDINKLQWDKLKIMLDFAYKNVPYYTKLFNDNGINPSNIMHYKDFLKIPILTKELARQHQTELYAIDQTYTNIKKGKTGGTTGVPIETKKDTNDRSYTWASYYRWYDWININIRTKQNIITFWGRSVSRYNFLNQLLEKIKEFILKDYRINAFHLNPNTIPKIYNFIIQKNPIIIKGYLSSIIYLAQYMNEHNLKPNKNLQCIASTTETILPPYKELIEKVFGVPLYDQYGCGEVSAISYECSHRKMHINSEHVFLEILDKINNPILNETGKIVVTSLDNFIMPFIRYENGDESKLFDYNCSCHLPFPIMDHIDGRTVDTIKLKDGSMVHGVFFTTLLYENNLTVTQIEKFQLIQEKDEKVIVFLQSTKLSQDEVQMIQKQFSRYINIKEIKVLNFIPLEKNGKFRYIKSDIL